MEKTIERIPGQIYLLWLSQTLSVFGSSVMFFAMNVWLTQVLYPLPEQENQLAWAITLAALAFLLPTIVLSPLGGVITDRYNRGKIMMVCDVINGLITAVIALGMGYGFLTLPLYLVLGLLLGSVGAVHGLAYFTVPTMLVSRDLLPRVSGLFRTTWSMANIAAPVLGALLISTEQLTRQGPERTLTWAIMLDALTFVLAGLVMLWIRVPHHVREDRPQQNPLKDIRPAWNFICSQKVLLQTFLVVSLVGLLYAPVMVTYPLIAKQEIHGTSYAFSYAAINVLLALGGVLGGMLTFAFGHSRFNLFYAVCLPMLLVGLSFLIIGSSSSLWWVGLGVLLASLMGPIYGSYYYFLWQKAVPPGMLGRVFGLLRIVGQAANPIGIALAGWLSQYTSAAALVWISGALIILLVLAALPMVMGFQKDVQDMVSN